MAGVNEQWRVSWNGLTPDQTPHLLPMTRAQAEATLGRILQHPRTYENPTLWLQTVTVSGWEQQLTPDEEAEQGHVPWSYTEVGVRCACGRWMDRDERCTRPRGSRAEHDDLTGTLFEAAQAVLEQADRDDLVGAWSDVIADLQEAVDNLAAWVEKHQPGKAA